MKHKFILFLAAFGFAAGFVHADTATCTAGIKTYSSEICSVSGKYWIVITNTSTCPSGPNGPEVWVTTYGPCKFGPLNPVP